jgi:hypothetical protein
MKAQASGCWPVYNNFAALKDTCHYGWKVDQEDRTLMLAEFKDKLISALKVDKFKDIEDMKQDIRTAYDWKNIAKDWSENLFNENQPICISDKNESMAGSAQVSGTK